jgi:transitional endoplasmic reticulum ATPase
VAIDYDRLAAESVGYTPAEIADRILGTELQRDLVESVVDADRKPVEPDTEFLLERLRANEPKTVRQYITSVRDEVDRLEGYPEMRRYVEQQAEELGINVGGRRLPAELLSASGGGAGSDPEQRSDEAEDDGAEGAEGAEGN